MVPLVSIYSGGVLTLLMALFHTRFYRMFGWKKEFENISALNRRVLYTVHLALLLLFFIIGSLSLVYAGELSRATGPAFALNLSCSLFWTWRLVWQLYYFRSKGGSKTPPIAVVLTIVFALLAISYLVPVAYSVF